MLGVGGRKYLSLCVARGLTWLELLRGSGRQVDLSAGSSVNRRLGEGEAGRAVHSTGRSCEPERRGNLWGNSRAVTVLSSTFFWFANDVCKACSAHAYQRDRKASLECICKVAGLVL